MPVSDVVEPSLEYAYTFTSAGVVNDLRPRQIENPNFRTLTAIERELQTAQDNKALYLNDMIIHYASVDSMELAVALLEQETDTAHLYGLVGTYIDLKDYSSASTTLSLIPDVSPEDQAFHDLYAMHISLGLEGKNLWQMSTTQEAMVRDIALMCPASLATTNARAILRLVFGETVPPCQGTGARTVYTNNDATYQLEMTSLKKEDKALIVYPNPTTGEVELFSSEQMEEVEITDVTGKIVFSEQLNTNSEKLHLNFLSDGVYYLKVRNANGSVNHKKLIKN